MKTPNIYKESDLPKYPIAAQIFDAVVFALICCVMASLFWFVPALASLFCI